MPLAFLGQPWFVEVLVAVVILVTAALIVTGW
jgi:hypothetical protein